MNPLNSLILLLFAFPCVANATEPPYDLHRLALFASQTIYDLPDLENSASGGALFVGLARFRKLTPDCYGIKSYSADPSTGLKYVIYTPTGGCSRQNLPVLVVFAGTQSTLDWLANLGDLHVQADGEVFQSIANKLSISHPRLLITGHSLGGGLAQAMGYSVLKDRQDRGQALGEVSVVTANAVGAGELLARLHGSYQASIAELGRFHNYFVTEDPISRIGTHVGPTYELPAPDPWSSSSPSKASPVFKLRDLAYRHSIVTVLSIATREKGFGLDGAVRKEVPSRMVLTRLTRVFVPPIGDLQRKVVEFTYASKVRVLTELLRLMKAQEPQTVWPKLDSLSAGYLKDLTDRLRAEDEKPALTRSPDSGSEERAH